ncbi:hypothetical protein ACIRRA_11840 [Nocardia sp. NPDC101769]|uniref:hypothetical protein n=1 Tax=Nocardia sp. NPDC101769 TaxID=3364333 RepID=UPI0038307A1B
MVRIALGGVVIALVIALGVVAGMLVAKGGDLDRVTSDRNSVAAERDRVADGLAQAKDRDAARTEGPRAEDIATQHAVGAATVDFHDFDGWEQRLKANAMPQLAGNFDNTAAELREILVPLQ